MHPNSVALIFSSNKNIGSWHGGFDCYGSIAYVFYSSKSNCLSGVCTKGKTISIKYYMLSASLFALMAERTASNKRTAAGIGTQGLGY